jgi:hypothetical protein
VRLTPGTRVGPYEVLASIGSGGMAEVYRARDTRLQREVAIKVVGDALASDAGFLGRLEQEARLAGSLNHPNIVAVHDIGVHEGAPYVVTELLQGETLRERLNRGPVPVAQALEWAVQIAHALAAASGHGIVHRDLKPENVFLTRTGQVKLLDFGIAKATAPVTEPRGLFDPTISPSGSSTRTGGVLGTPGYMSPEQVRGEQVDSRSDVFALGAILYELLSGQRAFKGGSVVESGYSILHDEPAPLPPTAPPDVAQVVQRCLAKDTEQRFQSARDVAFSLEAMRANRTVTPALPQQPSRGRSAGRLRRAAPLLAGAVLLGLAAFTLGRGFRAGGGGPPAIRQLTFQRGSVGSARFAPDGRTVHFSAAWGGGAPEVYTTTIDSKETRPLGLGPSQLLAVAPSGELAVALRPRFLYLFDAGRGTLARVPPLGGTPREVATDVEYADWAPDSKRLAAVRVDGTGSRLEFPLGRVVFKTTGWVSHPRVAPSGDQVAFINHPFPGDTGGMVMLLRAEEKVEQLTTRYDDVLGLAWTPGGEILVTAALPGELTALWAIRPGKSPRLVYRTTGNLLVNDVSRSGQVLITERDWRQEVVVIHGDAPPRSVEWLDWASVSAVSDDGKQVLFFESGVGAGGALLIGLRHLDRSDPVQLGQGRAFDLTGDGAWVLIGEQNDTEGKLRLMPTGPGDPRSLRVPGLSRIDTAAFFRDGKRLALLGRAGEESTRLYVYDMSSQDLRPISPPLPYTFLVAVSPDQRWVAASDIDGTPIAFPVEGGEPLRATELGPDAQLIGWLKDGALLAFDRYALPAPVRRFDPRTRQVTMLTTLAPADLTGVPRITKARVTPDGRTYAFHFRRMGATLFVLDLEHSTAP